MRYRDFLTGGRCLYIIQFLASGFIRRVSDGDDQFQVVVLGMEIDSPIYMEKYGGNDRYSRAEVQGWITIWGADSADGQQNTLRQMRAATVWVDWRP